MVPLSEVVFSLLPGWIVWGPGVVGVSPVGDVGVWERGVTDRVEDLGV